MSLKNPMIQQALALFGYGVGVGLRSTLDVRAVYSDPTVDPVHPDFRGRYVYAVLHETLLLPILMRSDPRMVTLASDSGDGEIIARALKYFGWASARGSTSRGGAAAILRFLRTDDRSPNLTVDGPRGPRRVMSPGAIFLASKLDLPMVCVGVGCCRPWRLPSWDRFVIPKPYSRIRFVFGPKRRVPAGLEREGLEGYRLWFENLLNWLTTEAEAWAESGRRRTGEIPMEPSVMSPPMPYWDPAHAVKLPESMNQAWAALPPGKTRAA